MSGLWCEDGEGAANQYGFTFERYGLRVPALIISPLIPRNLIDHRLYDHASVRHTGSPLRPPTIDEP